MTLYGSKSHNRDLLPFFFSPLDINPLIPILNSMAKRYSTEEAIEFSKACFEDGWETEGVYNALLDEGFSVKRTTTILLWVSFTHYELMNANEAKASCYQKNR